MTMKTYYVSTGGIDNYKVEEETVKLAALKAIRENNDKQLGLLASVVPEGGTEEKDGIYFLVLPLLEAVGLMSYEQSEISTNIP